MSDLTKVTYCGLYCGLCSQCNRVPQRARSLREILQKEGWDKWGAELEGFKPFWEFLGRLEDAEANASCRGGKCGPPFCGIRKCAQKKGVEVCPFCEEYPCHRIKGVAKGYVTMLADGERMKEIGMDKWIAEQEDRKATGFCYADIRCEPYDIPTD